MNRAPQDYDIATDARPEQVMKVFSKTVPVGVNFGVVKVIMEDSDFEVATFRSDGITSTGGIRSTSISPVKKKMPSDATSPSTECSSTRSKTGSSTTSEANRISMPASFVASEIRPNVSRRTNFGSFGRSGLRPGSITG